MFSPVTLFAGQVYEVEMACLFFSDWGEHRWALGDVCWEAAAMTEHRGESFVSGRAEKMTLLIRLLLLLLLLLCDRNDSAVMHHIVCFCRIYTQNLDALYMVFSAIFIFKLFIYWFICEGKAQGNTESAEAASGVLYVAEGNFKVP